jgi:hypothetical protein
MYHGLKKYIKKALNDNKKYNIKFVFHKSGDYRQDVRLEKTEFNFNKKEITVTVTDADMSNCPRTLSVIRSYETKKELHELLELQKKREIKTCDNICIGCEKELQCIYIRSLYSRFNICGFHKGSPKWKFTPYVIQCENCIGKDSCKSISETPSQSFLNMLNYRETVIKELFKKIEKETKNG